MKKFLRWPFRRKKSKPKLSMRFCTITLEVHSIPVGSETLSWTVVKGEKI